MTSPVRRLSQGKADGQKKPPIRARRRDKDQATPLTAQAKGRKEEGGQSGGEEEPEEESTSLLLLPPPMQIIKDPNNPEALDSDQGSNESDTEQRNKALRGRMFVVNEMIQSEKDYVKDLAVIVEVGQTAQYMYHSALLLWDVGTSCVLSFRASCPGWRCEGSPRR